PCFCEQGPLLCDSIATTVAEHKQYILRNPVHQPTQHAPCYAKHKVNTIRSVEWPASAADSLSPPRRAEYSNTGANHAEGGWPKDVQVTDPEQTQRHRRKVEKEDSYVHCVMSIAPGVDHYVMQNNAIEIYNTYYAEMAPLPAPERISCRTVNVYRDPPPVRPISSICWQPEHGSHFAVTYLDVDYNRNPRAPILSYIWDIENANCPETTIKPPCALMDLQYNPRDQALMAGGLVSGQVAVWDRRHKGVQVLLCAPHVAHRDYVRHVTFINAKSGMEFFSGGPDGAVKWWDLRNMSETTDEMIIDVPKSIFDVQSMANTSGLSALEFEPTIPTRFMCGTENGFVVCGNRKGKTPMEKLPAKFPAHYGPVWSLERNPGFLKNFLTVGDWTARVWSDDCRDSAVVWSPPHRHKITAGTWSPTRYITVVWSPPHRHKITAGTWSPTRYITVVWCPPHRHKITAGTWSPTRSVTVWNGLLALWELLRRQHEPTLTMYRNELMLSLLALAQWNGLLALWDLLQRQREPTLTMLSLLALAQWNGLLALWDLLRRQHEPVLTMQVCAEPLLRMRFHEQVSGAPPFPFSRHNSYPIDDCDTGTNIILTKSGTMLACGSRKGNIYMVEVSQNLAHSDRVDKVLLTQVSLARHSTPDCRVVMVLTGGPQMFDREAKRERILEARLREIRLKIRQAEEGSPKAGSATELDYALGDKDLAEATTNYMQQVKRELTML
ncbi:putative dynein intermediate chain 3, ciliary, partial [Operophtera brumata]